jgi:hypothetical protein
MREVVGLKTIDGILTTDRKSVETDVQKRLMRILGAIVEPTTGLLAIGVGARSPRCR